MIKKRAEEGTAIYAECGGLMYLTKSIIFGNKEIQDGWLVRCGNADDKKDDTELYLKEELDQTVLVSTPAKFRAHEFHYSKIRKFAKRCKVCL